LSLDQWQRAFGILKSLEVDFHLLLGNELMIYDEVVGLVDWLTNVDGTPYAFYTTSPPYLLSTVGGELARVGITNVSTGFDWFSDKLELDRDDPLFFMKRKSLTGLKGLMFFKERSVPDLHGTVTISKHNKDIALDLLRFLTKLGIWSAVNPVHWDKDGEYDFFPPREAIEGDILDKADVESFADAIKEAQLAGEISLQNPPEYFDAWKKHWNLDWHCSLPLVYSVDADGSMRCCGYRRGSRVPEFKIFDLDNPNKLEKFWAAWHEDAAECPGCLWSYWWQAEFLMGEEEGFKREFFQTHASRHFSFKD